MPGLDRARLGRLDGMLLSTFAALGGTLAWLIVRQVGSVFFYQMFSPETLMWACGQGLRNPLVLSSEMADFLLRRSVPTFNCATIAPLAPTGPPGLFFHTELYLNLVAAGLWRAARQSR